MTPEKYLFLYEKFLAGTCTPDEQRQLMEYDDKLGKLDVDTMPVDDAVGLRVLEVVRGNILSERGKVARLHSRRYWRWVAAASIVIAFVVFFTRYQSGDTVQVVKATVYKGTIAPGNSKAILTLSDGSKLSLADLKEGFQQNERNFIITKRNQKVVYEVKAQAANETPAVAWNTISTPNGGEFEIKLPDGSLVWLNAGSTLRFPLTFSNRAREVFLTGEAYFEVATQKTAGNKIPFRVLSGNQAVEVLGTHFNVNAYDNEESFKTTLLEGSVRVASTGSKHESILLAPGQQADFTETGPVLSAAKPNLDEVMAWHEGRFTFVDRDLRFIMKQLERWYDINVDYTNLPSRKFNGNVPRNVELAKVLRVLEKTSGYKFKVELVIGANGQKERRLSMDR